MAHDETEDTSPEKRVALDQLEVPADSTTGMIKAANEAIALVEMRRSLQRQAERDLVIEEMRKVINLLVAGHAAHAEEIETIKHAYSVLVRQQAELRERQDIIATVCDVFAKQVEEQSKVLAQQLEDATAP